MDTRDLRKYQEWYNSLSKQQRSEYVKGLGSNKKYAVQEEVIRGLARKYLDKTIKGCGYCLLSAHFELIKYNKMEKVTEYALKPGVVLHDVVNKSFNKLMTAKNVTEELSLYHLTTNPDCKKYFLKLPSDIDQRLAKYAGSDDMQKYRDIKTAALKKKIEDATAAYDLAVRSVTAAKEQLDSLKKELQSTEAQEIVEKAAKTAADGLDRPVVNNDTTKTKKPVKKAKK